MTILVTGGTGTIGSALVRLLREQKKHTIRIFSRDEYKQWQMQQQMQQEFGDLPNVRYLLGDVRDLNRLRLAMRGVDQVYHCAALKQVPACEYNPFEAAETNVRGTQNVIQAAVECHVAKLLFMSTDKAVQPTSVMGATKQTAERMVLAANAWTTSEPIFNQTIIDVQRWRGLHCSVVRSGNVIGSRGSIHEIEANCLSTHVPVPLSDPNMTRFWIPPSRLADWFAHFMEEMEGGEIFVPVMQSRSMGEIFDFEENCVRIPKRPGEKDHELLFDESEVPFVRVLGSPLGTYMVWRKDTDPKDDLPLAPREMYDSSCCLKKE